MHTIWHIMEPTINIKDLPVFLHTHMPTKESGVIALPTLEDAYFQSLVATQHLAGSLDVTREDVEDLLLHFSSEHGGRLSGRYRNLMNALKDPSSPQNIWYLHHSEPKGNETYSPSVLYHITHALNSIWHRHITDITTLFQKNHNRLPTDTELVQLQIRDNLPVITLAKGLSEFDQILEASTRDGIDTTYFLREAEYLRASPKTTPDYIPSDIYNRMPSCESRIRNAS